MRVASAPRGLARKSLGSGGLLVFCATASSPMTVLAGGIVATYATTAVTGVPLSFVVLTAALLLWTVGYLAMSRYLPSAGVFYAALAQGLGRFWGVTAAPVVLLAYNAIQISLYGLFGVVMGSAAAGVVDLPWWAWSMLAWACVAALGVLRPRIGVGLLATVLLAELTMIVVFDVVAFANPADGSVSTEPLLPGNLLVTGIGGVFALGIAAFIGYESAPVYSEEAREHRAVVRATYGVLMLLGVLYAVSAWAMAEAVGVGQVVDVARDPEGGLPFGAVEPHVGRLFGALATWLVVTSVFAAMLSFHSSVARYVFSLARERVLPAGLDRIGSGSAAGAPVAGSLVQSAVALVVVAVFAVSGADPVATLFTWLSAAAAIAVMLLMSASSVAAVRFFHRGGGRGENAWQRLIAPVLGAVIMAAILATTVVNISSVLGTEPDSPLIWLVPGAVAVSVLAGVVWAVVLRRGRPDVYRNVGAGQPKPLAVIEHDLADLRV